RMALVEDGQSLPQRVACRGLREAVQTAAADVTTGVTAERVEREQRCVGQQDQRPHADSEPVREAEGPECVPPEAAQDRDGEIEEVAVDVLEDEWEAALAEVLRARVRNGAGGRSPDEGPVIRLAIVVAGEPEPPGRPEDEERRRPLPPVAEQGHLGV